MEIDLALLADAATIDASGKLNILGIFDHLSAGSFPARHPSMVLILRFAAGIRESGKHAVEIRLKDSDGHELMHIDGEMQLAPGPAVAAGVASVPHLLNLEGVILPRAGRYGFDVRVDGEHQVTVPLTVTGPVGAEA
jgi:Family of unknown function (DUF6941)